MYGNTIFARTTNKLVRNKNIFNKWYRNNQLLSMDKSEHGFLDHI